MSAPQDPKDWMQDPATLTEEIDATREDAGQTLHALQEKLSPSQLLDQSLSYLTERGYDLACGIGRAAREHPVPFALAAAGTLWYLSRRRSENEVEIELDAELEEEALAGMEGSDGGIKSRARQASEAVGRSTRRAKGEFSRILEEQPLLVGAIGLAIGAAIASLVPVTESEDQLLGEKGERFVRRAKDMASEQLEKVREKGRRAADAARDAISEGNGSAGMQGTASGPSMQPNP